MNTTTSFYRLGTVANLWLMLAGQARAQDAPASGRSAAPFALAELGAKAGGQYQGDGLSVLPAPEGARLRCLFQALLTELFTGRAYHQARKNFKSGTRRVSESRS